MAESNESEIAAPQASAARRVERLGVVSYANVAPLHYGLEAWAGDDSCLEIVRGVPSELNASLLAGEIDLTLVSSIEFLRHRERLVALPDFSIATLGAVYSVVLFHWEPWQALEGSTIAVTTESATSVELLRVLLEGHGMSARLVPMAPDLDVMMSSCDAALLIGDAALSEGLRKRSIAGRRPLQTDLGEAWYRLTRLPFTFAVWASRRGNRPSAQLVSLLRSSRERGLGELARVAEFEAARRGIEASSMQRYLSNFRYYFELPDRDGLAEFARRSIPGLDPAELDYWPA